MPDGVAMNRRWLHRPEGSNWGDFGDDDELGAMNLVGPEQVRKGLAEVHEGRTFMLSLPLDLPGGNALHPRRWPPRRYATLRGGAHDGEPCFCFRMSRLEPRWTDVFSDDVVVLHTQYSTQWDGLAHAGAEFDADGDGEPEVVFYNGFRADRSMVAPQRARSVGPPTWDTWEEPAALSLGIERLARHGVQGRAVMIDLERRYGRRAHAVSYDELMRILEEDAVVVERGDMVCLHTGFDEVVLGMQGAPDARTLSASCAALDGSDARLLEWITATGIAALISDNPAVEAMPAGPQPGSDRHAMLPLHQHCLFKNGVHLGELWRLGELARWLRERRRSRFLLTAPPLHLPGAVGSPVSPVATV